MKNLNSRFSSTDDDDFYQIIHSDPALLRAEFDDVVSTVRPSTETAPDDGTKLSNGT